LPAATDDFFVEVISIGKLICPKGTFLLGVYLGLGELLKAGGSRYFGADRSWIESNEENFKNNGRKEVRIGK
jgi:hypothetical protein